MRRIITLCIAIAIAAPVHAQEIDYDALNLSDLLNMKVKVASMKELSAEESPGIITIITREEIENSGARDLTDILETVPGFDFGVDVEGIIGLGVRGNWAHEGKVLLLIDGQVMNEGLYSTLQFGNHYSIKNVRQIEIMRGPGSVIYGDYAEYAVINIITQKATDLRGISVTAEYGQMKESFARRGASFAAGKEINELQIDLKAGYLQGNRSDNIYKDVYGNNFDFTNRSAINNGYANLGMSFKGFSFRTIADFYQSLSADEYEVVAEQASKHSFTSYFAEVKHSMPLSKNLVVDNRFNIKLQEPWMTDEHPDFHDPFIISNKRYSYNLQAGWDLSPLINFSGGVETYYDVSENKVEGEVFKSNGKSTLDYYNTSIYAQLLWKNKIATITAGGRHNINSNYSSALVPRFGLTRTIGRFHFKLLYSISYRAPGPQNISLSTNIKPEVTSVKEIEAGCRIHKNLSLIINAFDIKTKNCIVYYYDSGVDTEGYVNKDVTGTQGIEGEIRFIKKGNSFRAGYAYYNAANYSCLQEYLIPDSREALLAFANHKAYLTLTKSISRNISGTAQYILTGKRNYIGSVDNDEPQYMSYSPSARLNTIIFLKKLVHKQIDIKAGVYNVTDVGENYIQPYNSLHAPLPGTGREFRIQLVYEFNSI